jgi:hypothetical protein
MNPPRLMPRILAALALQPMTNEQVSRCLSASRERIYRGMCELAKRGAIVPHAHVRTIHTIRRGGPQPIAWKLA